jgi:hypothetical protein
MDSDFVLMKNGGQIMAGGYIINDRLLIPSMSGGKNEDDDDSNEKKYAIPAGLFYINVPHEESSVEITYKKNDVLPDDIYDELYDNITLTKSYNKSIKTIDENKKKNNKKITKRQKITSNSNKKSRKHK